MPTYRRSGGNRSWVVPPGLLVQTLVQSALETAFDLPIYSYWTHDSSGYTISYGLAERL